MIIMFKVPKVIDKIQFGVLSPDDVRKMSVLRVITADTYDDDGYPIEKGLMDQRLGVIDPGLKCKTCGQKFGDCSGHFGHIELARPVIHVGHAKDVHKILKSVCRDCGKLKLDDAQRQHYREQLEQTSDRLKSKETVIKEGMDKAAKSVCPWCGSDKRNIKFEKPYTFYEEWDEERNKLTPIDVRERLEKIPVEDYDLIGVNKDVSKPEWMVLTVLPVPPVTVRPSITLESSVRSEDDLTHKLVDIIRINQRLRENIDAGAPQLIVEDLWELLQYHVTTYFNNSTSGIPPARHRSGRILKTISQRLSGKEGRFRSNLSGKRVDFSARTVVSPDPYISINEVGVPEFVACELTVPERVTANNLEEMKKIVRNGPNKNPGANYIIRSDRRRKKITDTTKDDVAEELDVGFTVERQLRDGDIVLFNRQPSLHRLSIMAHEVRVMPYKTFRLNLCVCPPYNADFDGDEMNLHLPQTEEARSEAGIIMKVQENIISPRYGEPVIGGMQDYISGAYLMTRDGSEFPAEEVQESFYESGLLQNKVEVDAFNERKVWTGKELFEVLLPKDLSLEFRSKACRKCEKCEFENCKYDNYVVIKEGKLLKGVIDGAAFKARSSCKLLDKIVKDYGSDEGREFLDSVTKLIISIIMKVGLTTGIDDVDIPEEGLERIDEILENAHNKVLENIEAYNRGELEKQPGQTLEDTLENRIMAELAKARDNAGAAAEKYLGMKRHAVIMAKTGAKGNMLDLTQMAACLGQMTVRGKRLHRGYQERSLPHFKPGDRSAKARGFVSSSYRKGLSPTEFFFHSMGGREGLVDTAVRTAQSGYMQRRLINALQDLKVEKDRSVRDNSNNIIQFEYGEDGVDPSRSSYGEAVDIDWIIHKTVTMRKE